ANLLLTNGDLHFAGLVPQVKEMQVSMPAAKANAPCNANLDLLFLLFGNRQAANLANGHNAVEPASPRVEAQRLDLPQLLQPAGFQDFWCIRHGAFAFQAEFAKRCKFPRCGKIVTSTQIVSTQKPT